MATRCRVGQEACARANPARQSCQVGTTAGPILQMEKQHREAKDLAQGEGPGVTPGLPDSGGAVLAPLLGHVPALLMDGRCSPEMCPSLPPTGPFPVPQMG